MTKLLGITESEYMQAVHSALLNDEVVRALGATNRISAEVRDALLTLYKEATQAHRQKTNET